MRWVRCGFHVRLRRVASPLLPPASCLLPLRPRVLRVRARAQRRAPSVRRVASRGLVCFSAAF